jgi:hypothetical protein
MAVHEWQVILAYAAQVWAAHAPLIVGVGVVVVLVGLARGVRL